VVSSLVSAGARLTVSEAIYPCAEGMGKWYLSSSSIVVDDDDTPVLWTYLRIRHCNKW